MGITVRSNFPELVKRQAYEYFFERYDGLEPVYPRVFEVLPSTRAFEQGTAAVGMGQLQEKPEGTSIRYRDPVEGHTWYIKMKTFADGFILTDEFLQDADDGRIEGFIREAAASWGEGVRMTEEAACARLFNKGALSAGDAPAFDGTVPGVVQDPSPKFIYDGKPFFATDHASLAGSTYANLTASLPLTVANLETAWGAITNTNARNERDEPVRIAPNVLLVPQELEFTAKTILRSVLLPGSPNNDINPVSELLEPVVWRYLEDTDGWFVGASKRGLRFYDRTPPTISVTQDPETKNWRVDVVRRFGVGVTNWRYWYAANVAQS